MCVFFSFFFFFNSKESLQWEREVANKAAGPSDAVDGTASRGKGQSSLRATPTHYAFLRVLSPVSFFFGPTRGPRARERTAESERNGKKHASSAHSAASAFLNS